MMKKTLRRVVGMIPAPKDLRAVWYDEPTDHLYGTGLVALILEEHKDTEDVWWEIHAVDYINDKTLEDIAECDNFLGYGQGDIIQKEIWQNSIDYYKARNTIDMKKRSSGKKTSH